MARRHGLGACIALLAGAAAVTWTGEAAAIERQWHVGIDAGYALGGFAPEVANGFAGGAHLTYGVSDAFNLRVHADVSAFDIPDPATSAILVNAAFGAEYVIDILQWVPYIGLATGPVTMLVQNGPTRVHLGIEIPGGLAYQLSREWAIGVELRYRALLFGIDGVSPTHGMLALGRVQYAWGF